MKTENDYMAYVRKHNHHLFRGNRLMISSAALEDCIKAAFRAGFKAGEESKSDFERAFGHKANETPVKSWFDKLLEKL